MIFAFSNLRDLDAALSSFQNDSHMKSFRLFEVASKIDEKIGFYGIACAEGNGQKVTLGADYRNFEELVDTFPQIKRETITTIWNSHSSWSGCFDVLSSLVHTHNSMMIDDSSNLLTDLVWPAITGSDSVHGDWCVQELGSALEEAHLNEGFPITEDWVDVLQGEDDDHPYEDDDEEDRPLQMDVVEVPTVHVGELHGTSSSGGCSYRDALLRAPPPAVEGANPAFTVLTPATAAARSDWKPSFVVSTASKRRIDKVYFSSSSGSAALEDCDDDPLSEYYESQAFVKGMVSLTRARAVTKMRPAALEQKLKRIADKTAAAAHS